MMRLGLIDVALVMQDQDEQVIIDALIEENKEKDLALKGALQRIKGLEAIKEMYLNATDALLKENEQYKLQEKRLILQLQKQQEQIRELKQNSRAAKYFEMEKQNLELASENHQLKQKVQQIASFISNWETNSK